MANQKYDNLGVLLAQGRLNWASGRIAALLCKGTPFTATHKNLSEAMTPAGSSQVASSPVGGRALSEDGAFLGFPVTFNRIGKEVDYQVLLVAEEGSAADPSLLAFYDVDAADAPLRLTNNGTLIVRPVEIQPPPDPPLLGLWLRP